MSHRYIFSELLRRHVADNSKNGVVGRTGKKIPMIPRTIVNIPSVRRSAFFISIICWQ
jgi:hypothetical protein